MSKEKSFDPQQQAILDCNTQHQLVSAGAGSGKTRLLTHRIAHIVKDLNVAEKNILAITFTNKAAREMKERLETLDLDPKDMWVCTFHAMCSRILRVHAEKVGLTANFSIYGDSEKDRIIKRVLQADAEFVALEKNKLKPNSVAWHISNAKNELLSPVEYAELISKDKYADIIINGGMNKTALDVVAARIARKIGEDAK